MTSQGTDKYQQRYLEHQDRKKKLIEGNGEFVEEEDIGITFSEIVESRRSQRVFSQEPIEEAELNYIKNAIINTPSSCNRQPISVKISKQSKKLSELLVGGSKWASKADTILLLMADMEAYKSPAEVDFMPYLDAGFIGMSVYYASETIGLGCCFINPNIREENKEEFNDIFNKEGYRFCGAIALGHYDKRTPKVNKSKDIFI